MAEHNYVRKVEDFVRRNNLLHGGVFHHIGVYHDDSCGIHHGGLCDCDPDVKLLGESPQQTHGKK